MSYSSFAGVYDALMKNADYKTRADYICKILFRHNIKNGLLLDLACGTGELSSELSRRGFEVIGTDASPEMLAVAQMKAANDGENILFLCQRMQETDLYGTVGAIVCTLDSINHLSSLEELNETFSRLKNFIDIGGIMIFDVNTPYKHKNVLGNNTFVYDEPGVFCVWQNTLYSDEKTVGINLDFFIKENGGKYSRRSESFKERAFSREELTAAFTDASFSLEAVYKENSFLSPDETTEREIYVIKRV